jgi:hypothetical protein
MEGVGIRRYGIGKAWEASSFRYIEFLLLAGGEWERTAQA